MSQIRRSMLMFGAGTLFGARWLHARAQAPQIGKVGFLFTPSRATSQVPALFLSAMREVGWVEGRNLTMEWRFADGNPDRLAELATQLVQQRVQVIVAPTNLEAEAALRATQSIPIVVLFAIDPVEAKFAKSIARPGGNVTGVLFSDPEFAAKSMQLIKDVVPTIRRIGYVYPAGLGGGTPFIEAMEAAARALGLVLYRYSVASPAEMSTVLDAIKRDGVEALRVVYIGAVQAGTAQLLEFAASNRIATLFTVSSAVERGGLMSLAPKLTDSVGRGAAFVDRLLKRALPADLPFEYPTRYELVINLKTATRLAISLPHSILLRADRVIE